MGYTEQKNFATSQASYDYILSLDADESLSAELQEEILSIKSNWQSDIYSIPRINNYCGHWIKHSGWYPDEKIRLFDRRKAKWQGKLLHEKVLHDQHYKPIKLSGFILHQAYDSLSEHYIKIDNYTTIAAKEKFQKGSKVSILYIIISTKWKFMKHYFLKLGFLDGFHGIVIAYLSSVGNFMKYAKLYKLNKDSDKSYKD